MKCKHKELKLEEADSPDWVKVRKYSDGTFTIRCRRGQLATILSQKQINILRKFLQSEELTK